jgi:hypothetical protein
MMEISKVNEIIQANEGSDEWVDLSIPEHLRRLV